MDEPQPGPGDDAFPFSRLLPEIQLLVWEAALPPRRIFHVRETTNHAFTFHIRHPPPPTLSVCRAARRATLSLGVFLAGDGRGAFFVPAVDVLYLDRNQRRALRRAANHTCSSTSSPLPHFSRIQHVGLEWRAFFARTPRFRGEGAASMEEAWRKALAPLRESMPALRTVTYVLPMVRHAGGMTWGREPYGAQKFEAELVTLPEDTGVPWGDALVLERGRGGAAATRGLAELMDGRRSFLVPWGDVRGVIDGSLNIEEDAEDGDGDWREEKVRKRGLPKLDLDGCWLLRLDARYDEEVSVFET